VRKTICFYGNCPARSRVTLVSKRIRYAYELVGIAATFATGCNNELQLSFFVGADDSAPASAPAELSVLQENGQVSYLVGEGETKWLEHGVVVSDIGSYLKVHAYNQDWYDHAVDVQITLEAK